jgi:hypothetical protein
MPALRKPLATLTRTDFEDLIANQWAEDELLEFKRTLPSPDGIDRWIKDQSGIGDRAKREILAEIVAFANSYGGDLIVGIDETTDKPPRASAISPLPKCVELAHRLELAARDLIRPAIPTVSIRGIPTEADNESGVVVARVPKSREAPHRLEMKGVEKECYKRVSDRKETMTMREIQDLTFAVKRGLDGIAERLNAQSELFRNWANIKRVSETTGRTALRVTVTPSTAELFVDRVHSIAEITPTNQRWRLLLHGTREKQAELHAHFGNWRPILRGTECLIEGNEERHRIQLNCDGTISYAHARDAALVYKVATHPFDRPLVHPITVFAMLLNAFDTAERFRAYAGAQAAEYAVDFEIVITHRLPLMYWRDDYAETAGMLEAGSLRFPTYSLQGRDTWNDLLTLIARDLYDAAGSPVGIGRLELAP